MSAINQKADYFVKARKGLYSLPPKCIFTYVKLYNYRNLLIHGKPINQLINQSINQSINQLIELNKKRNMKHIRMTVYSCLVKHLQFDST